jgi:hypothetical protein
MPPCHLVDNSNAKIAAANRPGLSVSGKWPDDQRYHDGLYQGSLELKTRLPSKQAWNVLHAFKTYHPKNLGRNEKRQTLISLKSSGMYCLVLN